LGFLDFHPKIGQHIKPDNLYKIIIADVAPLSDGSCPDREVIELWAGQPFEAKSQRADWTWRVARKPDSPTLALPIVQPCSGDWRVVWRAGHSVLADDKIKHALKGCYAGDLLFIRDLPPPEGGG
jgi:hypothetical protein